MDTNDGQDWPGDPGNMSWWGDTDLTPVHACLHVRTNGYPNRYGTRLEVPTGLKLDAWNLLLQGYEDEGVIEWTRFGWPISRTPFEEDPTPTYSNHASAEAFQDFVDAYIVKEIGYGAVAGPFESYPFTHHVGISPISTRPKREGTDRRVIHDLSWPVGSHRRAH